MANRMWTAKDYELMRSKEARKKARELSVELLRSNEDAVRSVRRTVNNGPKYWDPFAPDIGSSRLVKCWHCGEVYEEREVKWDGEADLWVCKNWPSCNGAGVGFNIHYKKKDDD